MLCVSHPVLGMTCKLLTARTIIVARHLFGDHGSHGRRVTKKVARKHDVVHVSREKFTTSRNVRISNVTGKKLKQKISVLVTKANGCLITGVSANVHLGYRSARRNEYQATILQTLRYVDL
ncbi:uncharacterized protein LOC131941493 [Physella acuta]|uniref:uncharacterized protein LOC131941493 n=1 Tax=Physella acuta TaxID=109671 RepID=UPI0027DB5ECD|nr:uncharacterized protein LOC131941493 [Physella acuta]